MYSFVGVVGTVIWIVFFKPLSSNSKTITIFRIVVKETIDTQKVENLKEYYFCLTKISNKSFDAGNHDYYYCYKVNIVLL